MTTIEHEVQPRCERPLAVVFSHDPERRATVTRALAQHAGVSAIGIGSLHEASIVARSVMLALVVVADVSEHEAHRVLDALRTQPGTQRSAFITCTSSTFASTLTDLVLPAEVGPNQVAAKARQVLDGRSRSSVVPQRKVG